MKSYFLFLPSTVPRQTEEAGACDLHFMDGWRCILLVSSVSLSSDAQLRDWGMGDSTVIYSLFPDFLQIPTSFCYNINSNESSYMPGKGWFSSGPRLVGCYATININKVSGVNILSKKIFKVVNYQYTSFRKFFLLLLLFKWL